MHIHTRAQVEVQLEPPATSARTGVYANGCIPAGLPLPQTHTHTHTHTQHTHTHTHTHTYFYLKQDT